MNALLPDATPVFIAPPDMSSMEATLRTIETRLEEVRGWDIPPTLFILTMLPSGAGVAPPGSRMVGAASFPFPDEVWDSGHPVAVLGQLAELFQSGAASTSDLKRSLKGQFAGLVLSVEMVARSVRADAPITTPEALEADYEQAVADGRWEEAQEYELRQVTMVTPGGARLAAIRVRGSSDVEVQPISVPGDLTEALENLVKILDQAFRDEKP